MYILIHPAELPKDPAKLHVACKSSKVAQRADLQTKPVNPASKHQHPHYCCGCCVASQENNCPRFSQGAFTLVFCIICSTSSSPLHFQCHCECVLGICSKNLWLAPICGGPFEKWTTEFANTSTLCVVRSLFAAFPMLYAIFTYCALIPFPCHWLCLFMEFRGRIALYAVHHGMSLTAFYSIIFGLFFMYFTKTFFVFLSLASYRTPRTK